MRHLASPVPKFVLALVVASLWPGSVAPLLAADETSPERRVAIVTPSQPAAATLAETASRLRGELRALGLEGAGLASARATIALHDAADGVGVEIWIRDPASGLARLHSLAPAPPALAALRATETLQASMLALKLEAATRAERVVEPAHAPFTAPVTRSTRRQPEEGDNPPHVIALAAGAVNVGIDGWRAGAQVALGALWLRMLDTRFEATLLEPITHATSALGEVAIAHTDVGASIGLRGRFDWLELRLGLGFGARQYRSTGAISQERARRTNDNSVWAPRLATTFGAGIELAHPFWLYSEAIFSATFAQVDVKLAEDVVARTGGPGGMLLLGVALRP